MSAADAAPAPRHIAVIMDGNGRWAKARGLARNAGHRKGMDAAYDCAVACREAGVPYLSLFAFSTDNWQRPAAEVKELIALFDQGLRENFNRIVSDNLRIRFIGDVSEFPRAVRKTLDKVEEATAGNDALHLQIALNYSGKWDIIEAARRLADTGCDLSAVTEEQLGGQLAAADWPDPDLLIRTSGELRLSNFMLWQAAYAELYFTDVLWPDFSAEDLQAALAAYAQRERRYGKVAPAP